MRHLDGTLLMPFTIYCIVSGCVGHSVRVCQDRLHHRCSSGRCIPVVSVCDGRADCQDGSDELDCSVLRCKQDEFSCRGRRCVPLHSRCDGSDDCGDSSDEASCQNCSSVANSFPCGPGSGLCLPRTKLCDGRADCPDGRDEGEGLCRSTTPPLSPMCSTSEFRCGDGQCVPLSWKCDRSSDCSDGSDEDNCDQDECVVNNGGCSHQCVDLPLGFLCTCPVGMRLVGENQCEELDRCLDNDVCDQFCVQVEGNLTCSCSSSYQLSPDTGECTAKGDAAQLVFVTSQGIRSISATGGAYKELVSEGPGPGPGPQMVAAFTANLTLYWAQQGHGSIYRVSMDGTPGDPMLVLKGLGALSGVAVDWIHQQLYWVDTQTASLNVGPLDGSAQRLLLGGLQNPTAVAVEPLQGFLFWAESGGSPKIERASLVGRDRMALVTSSIHNPVALSLDMPRQLLYWADQGMRTISRVDLMGRHRKTVVESNGYMDRPLGLAVFEGLVYWSDDVTQSICSADKRNGGRFRVFLRNSLGGLVIVHPVLQPNKIAVLQDAPVPMLTDPTSAGILCLILFLSMLLVAIAVWWWREEFKPSRNITLQSFSHKESRDPLIQVPHIRNVKEMLPKLDLDSD